MTNSKCPSCVIQHDKTVMRYDFNKFNQRNVYLRFTLLSLSPTRVSNPDRDKGGENEEKREGRRKWFSGQQIIGFRSFFARETEECALFVNSKSYFHITPV